MTSIRQLWTYLRDWLILLYRLIVFIVSFNIHKYYNVVYIFFIRELGPMCIL